MSLHLSVYLYLCRYIFLLCRHQFCRKITADLYGYLRVQRSSSCWNTISRGATNTHPHSAAVPPKLPLDQKCFWLEDGNLVHKVYGILFLSRLSLLSNIYINVYICTLFFMIVFTKYCFIINDSLF